MSLSLAYRANMTTWHRHRVPQGCSLSSVMLYECVDTARA